MRPRVLVLVAALLGGYSASAAITPGKERTLTTAEMHAIVGGQIQDRCCEPLITCLDSSPTCGQITEYSACVGFQIESRGGAANQHCGKPKPANDCFVGDETTVCAIKVPCRWYSILGCSADYANAVDEYAPDWCYSWGTTPFCPP